MAKFTNVTILLDDSGSMKGLRTKALAAFNRLLDKIRQEADDFTKITVTIFETGTTTLSKGDTKYQVPDIQYDQYRCLGNSTALYDAIQEAINESQQTVNQKNTAHLIYTITDGMNNAGATKPEDLAKVIKSLENTDKWTFVMQVPKNQKGYITRELGLQPGNVEEWDQTEKGIYEAETKTSAGVASYFDARSKGETSVRSFYADANGINAKALPKVLDDITKKCKVYDVKGNPPIRDFVEKVTKRPYKQGNSYYKIEKRELLQARKDILIRNKKNGKIYSGEAARALVGLPLDKEIKVSPVYSPEYDIFVLSTSFNRKLSGQVIVREQ